MSASEWQQFVLAKFEIVKNKQTGGNRSNEEICAAQGLTYKRYWEIVLRKEQNASDFEQTLIAEFLSSKGFVTPDHQACSLFKLSVRRALREALALGKPWIRRPAKEGGRRGHRRGKTLPDHLAHIKIGFPDESDINDDLIIVSPRDAIKWLVGNPRRECLVSANLRTIVKSGGPTSEKVHPNVSKADLVGFLNKTADGQKKEPELLELAKKYFPGKRITDALWRGALKGLSSGLKRRKGDTDRTINKLKDNPAA